VKDLRSGRVYISSQNHGYHVAIPPPQAEITHVSLSDQTIEGMAIRSLGIQSVQFHPEASPGPVENSYLFDEFLNLAKGACDYALK
jgi:carbamoyl-phosphate synthase small subunit